MSGLKSKQGQNPTLDYMRIQARSFASSFCYLATEAGQSKGSRYIRIKLDSYPSVEYIHNEDYPDMDSLVLSIPDPTKTLHFQRMDQGDPAVVALNATALHEIAHILFGTHDFIESLALTSKCDLLAANLLADVCDEAALIAGITDDAEEPLAVAHEIIRSEVLNQELVESKPIAVTPELIALALSCQLNKLVVLAAVQHDIPDHTIWIHKVREALQQLQDRAKCLAVADYIPTEQKTIKLVTTRDDRFREQFKESITVVSDFLGLFEPKPPQSDQDQNQGKDQGSVSGKPSTEEPDNRDRDDSSGGENKSQNEKADTEKADAHDAHDAHAEAVKKLIRKLRKEKIDTDGQGLNPLGGHDPNPNENEWVLRHRVQFNRYREGIRKLIKQLLRSKKFALCKPAPRGSWVRDVHRAYTDGRIFVQRTEVEGINSAVAILVDCSESTIQFSSKLLAFAGCLAEGCLEAEVATSAWLFGQKSATIPVRLLSRINPPRMGGTIISTPIKRALEWFDDLPPDEYQRKVIVLLTDGCPATGDYSETELLADHANSIGVSVIVGCIKDVSLHRFIEEAMPHAIPFTIHDNFAVSAVALAKQIALTLPLASGC